jgi:hypothetical protein
MGTVIGFGFRKNKNNKNIFQNMTAPQISLHKKYEIPTVFVQMDDDIKYGSINISALKNDQNLPYKNVIAFNAVKIRINQYFFRIQIPLIVSHARSIHSAQGIYTIFFNII